MSERYGTGNPKPGCIEPVEIIPGNFDRLPFPLVRINGKKPVIRRYAGNPLKKVPLCKDLSKLRRIQSTVAGKALDMK
jgi:hypothetical protein